MKNNQPDLFKVSDFVFDRYSKLGHTKLTPPEKVFVCVWGLESEVNNGGFNQYYFNSSGDHAVDAEDSFRAIGAKHTAELVKQANNLFGPSGPSPNRAVRQEQLDSLSNAQTKKMIDVEEKFLKNEDKLRQLIEAYVSENFEFFRSK